MPSWTTGWPRLRGYSAVVRPWACTGGGALRGWSRIETADETRVVAEVLTALLGTAEAAGVELHLETSLDPADFASLLNLIPTRW